MWVEREKSVARTSRTSLQVLCGCSTPRAIVFVGQYRHRCSSCDGGHPSRDFFQHTLTRLLYLAELIHALTHGFNIGYTGPRTALIAPNLCSAMEHPHIVDEALHSNSHGL